MLFLKKGKRGREHAHRTTQHIQLGFTLSVALVALGDRPPALAHRIIPPCAMLPLLTPLPLIEPLAMHPGSSIVAHTTELLALSPIQTAIEAIRDTAQVIYRPSVIFLTTAGVGALIGVGINAWEAGRKYRVSAGSSLLTEDDFGFLLACITIDAIGAGSLLLPGGEIDDVVWAPLSAFILRALFQSDLISAIDFIKELLPFSDVLPIATIAWLLRYGFPDSPLSRALGVRPCNIKDDKSLGS